MKYILTFLLAITASFAFAQSDSTKTDTVKVKKKNWSIELNDQQDKSINDFDAKLQNMQMQFQIQYNALIEQKNAYLRSILEGKKIDVSKVSDFKYEKGKLVFIETKP